MLALLLAGVEIGLNATIEAGTPRQLGVTIGVLGGMGGDGTAHRRGAEHTTTEAHNVV